jgi:hypothetical protein
MFCDKCQKIFDLDTSFCSNSEVEGGAARTGCSFCQLVVENHCGGSQEISSPILPSSKWQVTVQFSHDSIIVNIPMRIDCGECDQDIFAENYEFGEDNIKLDISTEHGQLS